MQGLATAMKSKAGVIWVTSPEEVRVERVVTKTCLEQGYAIKLWSVTNGLESPDGTRGGDQTRDPREAIKAAANATQRTAFIFRDLSPFLGDATTARALKDVHRMIPTKRTESAVQVVCIDTQPPPDAVPVFALEWPYPDRDEISAILDSLLKAAPDSVQADVAANGNRSKIIDAAVGLTAEQVSAALAKSLVECKTFDPAVIAAEKKQAIKGSGLEWYDADPRGMGGIGGLDNLKQWLVKRYAGFTPAGREYGLPAPRGVLLVGVPGCGKSLTAKCAATAWNVPLLKLDMGAMFGKYVGQSEGMIRQALRMAETIAPCVLWVDEIEKSGFGGSGDADGGTTQRVLGTLLTWMQERQPGVFVIATANDVSKLPPEFLRAGRWDDMFYVDLPTRSEREQIVEVMKAKFDQCAEVEATEVAANSDGYTGAEIEAGFVAALYTQFERSAPVDSLAVVTELEQLTPISRSMAEKVNALREWAKGRARRASVDADTTADVARAVEL